MGAADEVLQRGLGHHRAGRLADAEAEYHTLLAADPHDADALHLLGVAADARGDSARAVALIGQALQVRDSPPFHANLGMALGHLGRHDEALAAYRQALRLRPEYPEALNNLGASLKALGRPTEAAEAFRRALGLKPDFAEASDNLHRALAQIGCHEPVACGSHSRVVKPDAAEACNNQGVSLALEGKLSEAAACFHSTISLKPDFPEAHNNLALVLKEQGRLAESIISYREAVGLKPDFAEAHYNLALALLKQGDLAAGWSEYEWRWKTPQLAKDRRAFLQPRWRGEAAAGRTLLIHAEQGFGDTLQFCRYAPLAAARGLRVIVEAPRPLVRLLRSLSPVDEVIEYGQDLPAFDLCCPMLSLPLAFGSTLATIPKSTAYLHADEAQAAAWRTRLAAMPARGIRIGLVWAGNSGPAADHRRSLSPDLLAPLFGLPGTHFFSLQKDGPAAPAAFPLTDFMEEMADFADTAALIANLDLVISVDTAVAHLALALGKPVWMLAQFDPCWRWLVGRRDSPWYPALRLYSQPQPGAWDLVVAALVGDLRPSPRGFGALLPEGAHRPYANVLAGTRPGGFHPSRQANY